MGLKGIFDNVNTMHAIETDVIKLISDLEADPNVNVRVPSKLSDPVDLVAAAKQALSIRNETTERSLRNEGVLVNTAGLSVRVSPKNVNRALLIFDTLIKAFRARGHKFIGSNVDIDGQVYEISIREKLKKIENDYKKVPTNILCIKAFGAYPILEIYDSKSVLIEEKIARAVAKLELEVKGLKEIWAKNDRIREIENDRKRTLAESLAKQKKELADFKLLLNSAHRAFESKIIRDYIQLVEDKAKQVGSISLDLENWISWAHEKADWYDPHIEREVELLKEVDRNTLMIKNSSPLS